jgi:hypothetical protein
VITLKEWMETINYRVTEGDNYCWDCYGPNAYSLSSWNGNHDGYSLGIVFDNKTQEVYEVQAHDFAKQRAYRLINPAYFKKYKKESKRRDVNLNEAWDNVDYVDLDVDEDFLEKAQAIVAGEDYDTRVQIEVVFSDEDMLQYMKAAHKLDITFNQFVEKALTVAIEKYKEGVVE